MSHKKPIPQQNELEAVYNKTKSISKTAKHFATSNPTVRKWLNQYGIYIFSHKEAVNEDFARKKISMPSKKDLEFLYSSVSIEDIREMYGIGQDTFYEWIDKLDIPRQTISSKVRASKEKSFHEKFGMTKEKLQEDYDRLCSMEALSDEYGCSLTTIKKLFKMHSIQAIFSRSSYGQIQVANFIQSLGFDIIQNDRKIIFPLELDIVIPEKKIAIEYCGIYYHSETWGNKHRNYHLDKLEGCLKNGYDLITVFESEWKTKKEIVKSIIMNKCGVIPFKIYARDTVFKEVSYAQIKNFEDENHLHGTRPAGKYYVLLDKNGLTEEIVMSLSVGKSRFNKNYTNEVVRMTSKKNHVVVGGMSKLIKNIGLADCVTYADRRYGEGDGYVKVGFQKLIPSMPNYFYFNKKDHDVLYSRNKFQKHKIPNVDTSLSEYENMLSRGYDRIWDCGNGVYYYK